MVRVRSTEVKAVDEQRPLPHLGINVLLDVWSVSQAVGNLLNAALAPSGLNADEFAIYSLLARQGPLTPTELSRQMAAPPTTVSSYINRFHQRGHVQRNPNPRDRRSYRVSLTDRGRETHRAGAALFMPVLRQLVEDLGPAEPEIRASLALLRNRSDDLYKTMTSGDKATTPIGEHDKEALQ